MSPAHLPPFMRPAAGFGQIEVQVLFPGMAAKITCASRPLAIVPRLHGADLRGRPRRDPAWQRLHLQRLHQQSRSSGVGQSRLRAAPVPSLGRRRRNGRATTAFALLIKEKGGMTYSKGDRVKWNWGNGTGEGRICEVFEERVTRTIKGSEITRDADPDNPAYMIEQDDGDRVLKSHGEVEKAG